MKTWKILGLTGLMLVSSLFWSGAAEARRFNNSPYYSGCQSRIHNPHYGVHRNPHWSGAQPWARGHNRHQERFRHEGQRQHNWNRHQNRFAQAPYRW